MSAYRGHNGRVHVIGVDFDITDRKRAEEVLRGANEQKDEFLGLVSHELRNPIATVYGAARLLRSGREIAAPDREDLLADIEGAAERMRRVLEDLITLARADLGRLPEFEPVLLQHVVERVAADFRRRNPTRKLVVSTDDSLVPVLANAGYLEQILQNLLANSDKYSSEGVPIEIAVSPLDGRYGLVRILDEGFGLTEQELTKLFQPFYRSTSAQSVASGSGLGLTVCQRLVEAQGGSITALARPELGLEVRFTVPFAKEAPVADRAEDR
jgi:two-component system OmpR family sensor kinase